MRIWRVTYDVTAEGNQGYSYHESKHEAKEAGLGAKASYGKGMNFTISVHDIPLTKAAVIEALNRFGDHNDNG